LPPQIVSDNHHHGESETAIFVRSGNPEFAFHDSPEEVRIVTAPGDYSSCRPRFRIEKRIPTPPNLRSL